jgi:hypothetical protein
MYNYNPVNKIATLGGQFLETAWAELSNENAHEFYKVRAQQDIGLLIWAVGTAAIATYNLGIQTRNWVYASEAAACEEPTEESRQDAIPGKMLALPPCGVRTATLSTLVSPVDQAIAYKQYIERILGFSAWWVVAKHLTVNQLRSHLISEGYRPRSNARKEELLKQFTK